MSWWELSVRARREHVERLSGVLFALGAAGVQEDWLPGEAPPPRQPWDTGPPPPEPPERLLRAWFEDPDPAAVGAEVVDRAGGRMRPEALQWSPVREVDWEARFREGFAPIVVSPRLVVAPPWDAPEGAVVVEPGQGFGTGQHPTTRQALVALDALADAARTVLDVGCGSGVLALAAARLGLHARGIDVEAPAVEEARANATRNALQAEFSTTPLHEVREPADLVLANLYAELLVALAPDLARLTRHALVLAGILAEKEDAVRAAFPGWAAASRAQDGEWVCLVLRRRA